VAAGGSTLAVGGSRGEVVVWNVAAGAVHARLDVAAETESISAVAFSPDGRFLAVSSMDRTIQVWDVPGARRCGVLHGHTGAVYALAFSADSRRLASGGFDRSVRLWDLEGIVEK
jgi:WD40 repeat protein